MNTASPQIAVIGASGQTGSAVVKALSARTTVRALTRDIRHKQTLLSVGAVDVGVADLHNVSSLAAAFAGVRAVHIIPPVMARSEVDLIANVMLAAESAHVQLMGYHSALHSDEAALPHHLRKNHAEVFLRNGSIPWVILRPGMYHQTPERLFKIGGDALPFGGSAIFTPIGLADVAEITSIVLTDSAYQYGTFELCGPERLTIGDMWEIVNDAPPGRAKKVLPWQDFLGAASATSMSQISDYAAMLAHYEHGGLHGSPAVAAMLLGRPPTSFGETVSQASSFGG